MTHCPRAFSISFNCFCIIFTGQWLGLCFVSLFKPFYFCIKGGEAFFFFFFFLGYIYTSQIRKCPNQIGGQVATGNHSSKPFLFFFFFPFLSETPCRRKVNEMSVGRFIHRANTSFNTRENKEENKIGTKSRKQTMAFIL